MNKFFIRKEAAVPSGLDAVRPGVAQALPSYGGNPGQPAAWEKPIYAIQRQLNKLPSWLQRGLGTNVKPSSKVMFDPKDNPEAYHAELYNMAVAHDNRLRQTKDNNLNRLMALRSELGNRPWRSFKLGPYMKRAEHMFRMSALAPELAWKVGEPGSVNAMNYIDDIKYGKPVKY